MTPWYRETVEEDRARLREIEALRRGMEYVPPRGSPAALRRAILAAAAGDADAFRAFLATRCCLARQAEVLADERLLARILELATGAERPPLPGPDRERLLQLLAASPTAA